MDKPAIWITGPVAEVALTPLAEIAEIRLRRAGGDAPLLSVPRLIASLQEVTA